MRIKITYIFAIVLVASVLVIAACGSKDTSNTIKGTETTTGTSAGQDTTANAVAGPDTGSVDTLNNDLNPSDLDNIAVTVDENTFK